MATPPVKAKKISKVERTLDHVNTLTDKVKKGFDTGDKVVAVVERSIQFLKRIDAVRQTIAPGKPATAPAKATATAAPTKEPVAHTSTQAVQNIDNESDNDDEAIYMIMEAIGNINESADLLIEGGEEDIILALELLADAKNLLVEILDATVGVLDVQLTEKTKTSNNTTKAAAAGVEGGVVAGAVIGVAGATAYRSLENDDQDIKDGANKDETTNVSGDNEDGGGEGSHDEGGHGEEGHGEENPKDEGHSEDDHDEDGHGEDGGSEDDHNEENHDEDGHGEDGDSEEDHNEENHDEDGHGEEGEGEGGEGEEDEDLEG
jgi:cobalamin biosynthesis protein CobT